MLVNSKEFMHRVRQLKEVIANWDRTPMLFGGKLEPLNALIDVGLLKPKALDDLIALAERKRKEVPASKRIDYQRQLMREKRERLQKAVRLEELVRGVPLRGGARTKYMHDVQVRWMNQRADYIRSQGELTWKARNEAAARFWMQVDERLEHDLAEATAVLGRPPMKRKRVVVVDHPKPVTALSRAFEKARR